MSKRNKQRNGGLTGAAIAPAATRSGMGVSHLAAHPPAKNPTLLAVSIVLFALWFVFLLVTALVG